MGPSVVAPWSSLLLSVGSLLRALARRRRGPARSSAAAPGKHRTGRRLLLEALDCIRQYGHLPYDGRDLRLRGHCGAWRAGLRRRRWQGGLFPMGRAPRRPDDPRSLGSCLCHVVVPPTWRANLLRPIASSPDRREACTCKRKSALTGGGSGGDPPTVKSER